MQASYKQNLYKLLIYLSIFKIIASYFIELGNDEAYYFTYALKPAFNYFDHPPLVGFLIRLTTLNLTGVNDACMRLGPIICSVIASIFIFKTGTLLKNEKAGWYAALIYNCSIYTGFIAGWFILPDAPQAPFWCISLYLMCNIILKNRIYHTKSWLYLGITIGLATLAKVHGLYLWAGFGLFILIYKSIWLLQWRLYFAAFITCLFASPIIIWNIQNNFISYTFHSERVTDKTFNPIDLLREILGEFIYQNPIVFVVLVLALIYFIRQKSFKHNPILIWLLCMSVPMIFLFWGVSSFNPIFPHWSGPGYIALYILAALYIEGNTNRLYPIKLKLALGLSLFILVVASLIVNFVPRNFGSQNIENYGEYCPTLDISGWKNFSEEFAILKQKDVELGRMKFNAPILIKQWFPGAQLEYYTARISKTTIIAAGTLNDVHQFAWLNKDRSMKIGDDAYVIVPSNAPLDVFKAYGNYFSIIEKPQTITQLRGKKAVRYFYVWRLKNCKNIDFITKL